jgi:hypothetical protein
MVFADAISHRGHSVAVRHDGRKCVVQTDELTDVETSGVQTSGTYLVDRDPKERVLSEVDDALGREARQLVVNPEGLRRTDSGGVDGATKDRLKQLGYAE